MRLANQLWAGWTGGGRHPAICYHLLCHHEIAGRQFGEIQHLLSPQAHPELTLAPQNLKPVHAGGRKRCPDCGLSCQNLAAGNLAERDPMGRPLPFSLEFIESAKARIKPKSQQPRSLAKPAPVQPPPQVTTPPARPSLGPYTEPCEHSATGGGRCFDCMAPRRTATSSIPLAAPAPVSDEPPERCEYCNLLSGHHPGCPVVFAAN